MTSPTPPASTRKEPPKEFVEFFHHAWECQGDLHMHGPLAVKLAWEEGADLGGAWRVSRAAALREAAKVARAFNAGRCDCGDGIAAAIEEME